MEDLGRHVDDLSRFETLNKCIHLLCVGRVFGYFVCFFIEPLELEGSLG